MAKSDDPLALVPAPNLGPAVGPADDTTGNVPRVLRMNDQFPAPMCLTPKVDLAIPNTIVVKDHRGPREYTISMLRVNLSGSIHGVADEARFRAHIESQIDAVRQASDSLRDMQASTSRLEAQVAANEIRAQTLVSHIAELEAKVRNRELMAVRTASDLAEVQQRLDEANLKIVCGDAKLAYMHGQVDTQAQFANRGAYGPRQPFRGRRGAIPSGSYVRQQRRTTSTTNPGGDTSSLVANLPSTERKQIEGEIATGAHDQLAHLPPPHGSRPFGGGSRNDFANATTTRTNSMLARRPTTYDSGSRLSEADIIRPLPITRPTTFDDICKWLVYFEHSPGERPLGVPVESSLEQLDMIQVWLWINQAGAELSRLNRHLFTTNTLSLMWNLGTFEAYRASHPCEEIFNVTLFTGDPANAEHILTYWNDTSISLSQAAMFSRYHSNRAAAQAAPPSRQPARTRAARTSELTNTPFSLVVASTSALRIEPPPIASDADVPMDNTIDFGSDNDENDGSITLPPEAIALGRARAAITAIMTAAGVISPSCSESKGKEVAPRDDDDEADSE
ncbi:hypothetical protein JAAARDRAFT_198560 [Jaapia argillacea MUCL 33604]|uniref:Uncharacterized protein n=1 Tax=Jaapia argillacea MUCL 33604 TaxID=933084 RepID=A0A067PP97_9AGAM|nr:hypothetical protein JAAARDRAFT_198560 [Jaapia argillacea MUCL 33604]